MGGRAVDLELGTMKKKLIIISGPMGVGKTTICDTLYRHLYESCWIEGDAFWRTNPFISNEEETEFTIDNITYIINRLLNKKNIKYIVFDWVIHTEKIMDEIIKRINKDNLEVYKITLYCTEEELLKRNMRDIEDGKRDSTSIRRGRGIISAYEKMNTIKIDTTSKEISEVVHEIYNIVNQY